MSRLPQILCRPLMFYAAALVSAGLACVVFYSESQGAASRALALRHGAPATIAIEDFDTTTSPGPSGEVMIAAQIDATLPLQVFYRQGLTDNRALAYPVRAVSATRDSVTPAPIIGYFYVDVPMRDAEVMDVANLMPPFEKVGDFGPVTTLNGELSSAAMLEQRISGLLRAEGNVVAERLLGVRIYRQGRAVALTAPRRSVWPAGFLALALCLLAAGAAMSVFLTRNEERQRLMQISEQARNRKAGVSEPAGEKGRRRLTPLAPPPESSPPVSSEQKSLGDKALRGWATLRDGGIRNPR